MPRWKLDSGWKRLPGPPGHGMSSVWEHPSGARLHMLGTVLFVDGTHITEAAHWKDMRRCAAMQPKRRRCLLLWAQRMIGTNGG